MRAFHWTFALSIVLVISISSCLASEKALSRNACGVAICLNGFGGGNCIKLLQEYFSIYFVDSKGEIIKKETDQQRIAFLNHCPHFDSEQAENINKKHRYKRYL